MIEKGIKIGYTDLRDIKGTVRKIKKYNWVYIGGEFCENLLDLYLNSYKALSFFNGKKICFLTPIITEKNIPKLLKVLQNILSVVPLDKFEVSVNDFGALNIIKKTFPNLIVNIGRHLAKHFFSFQKNAIKFHTEFSVIAGISMNEIGIERYELSYFNLIPKNNFLEAKKKKVRFKFSMFYPYVLLSTTRTCLIGSKDIPPEQTIDEIRCLKECLFCDYFVKTYKIKEEMTVCENSTFIKLDYNEKLATRFSSLGVDRLIFCPRP
ncbi:MAG: hypothetical protein K6357_07865 [Elusimicrobiota bacterium]